MGRETSLPQGTALKVGGSAEETLQLLEQALAKRCAYVRRRIDRIPTVERKQGPRDYKTTYSRALRGGMLSELSTVHSLIKQLQAGAIHPDKLWNEEDDPGDD